MRGILAKIPLPSFLKTHKRISIIVLVVLLLLIFIFRPKAPTPIDMYEVKRGDIVESLSASGTISSQNSVNLHFLSAGKLVYVGVKKGDSVVAGQTVASLDQRTVQKNLEVTLRDYAKQRNTFDQTLKNNSATKADDAVNDTVKRVLQNNQYDLEKAVLSTELQDLARQQAVLSTPIAGIVTRADVTTAGTNVTASDTFGIADPHNLIFQVEVDEADIGKITLSQSMKIVFDAYPNDTVTLPISRIDFASHTTATGSTVYGIEADVTQNDEYRYKIGMSGDAEIILAQKNNVIIIPLTSISDDGYVYVKKDKTYEKKKVVLGLKNDTESEVTSGLAVGDIVALQATDAEQLVK